MSKASVSLFSIIRSGKEHQQVLNDLVAVEEPLEIILDHGPLDQRKSVNLAITMRTPGNDLELVTGFLATEQLIDSPEQVASIRHCRNSHNQKIENTVKVQLHPLIKFEPGKSLRHFYINSSCGVCGKTSIDSVIESCNVATLDTSLVVSHQVIRSLPAILREKQLVFDHTGGLHAACIFDNSGNPLWLREDVGRHNAVDKVLGASFSINKWPLNKHVLLVSGRISFELVQKALRAGILFMAAIGAPSSLAVELAKRAGMTLLGFVGAERFNIYHGAERVKGSMESSV
ncbi:MAG: sulfurtransferase FdhD [Cyclobacteriaceae bacterium]|nr:MAG: sulfurtransferase FdhD [Cyclobacteriaceae bacterium]